jgi:hypothetical protein
MSSEILAQLFEQFALARHARAELLRLLGELGATSGVEVLSLQPGEAADVWDLRVRIPTPTVRHAPTHAPAATVDDEPEPFVSPARHAEPFVGDGTVDLPRLIAASDPRVRVPPRGTRLGDSPPPLDAEERLRMLAGTIAGDALLSLQHQGRERDGAAVRDALGRAREHYAREVERAGGGTGAELLARFDAAADGARRQLVGVG